tara:strand:+ start:54 stop:242 length:189 start_codon:yes stop_codon:yes gene_type:complete
MTKIKIKTIARIVRETPMDETSKYWLISNMARDFRRDVHGFDEKDFVATCWGIDPDKVLAQP